jgi:hypothetical protein
LTLLTISEDGEARLTSASIGIYSDYINFLYSILLDKKLDPSECAKRIRAKLGEKKLLFGKDVGEPLVGNELKDVFADLKKRNVSTCEDFKKAFYAAIEDHAKKRYSIAYPLNIKLAYPLNIRLNSRIERQIDGKTLKIVNFDEFSSHFDVGRILNGELGDELKHGK